MNRLPLDVCVAALVHCNENVARHYIGARRIAQRCVIGPLFWLWSSNFPYESTCSLTFLNKRVRGSDSLFAAFKFQNGNIFWWITPIIGIEGLSPSLDPRDLRRGVRRLTTGLRMGGARYTSYGWCERGFKRHLPSWCVRQSDGQSRFTRGHGS